MILRILSVVKGIAVSGMLIGTGFLSIGYAAADSSFSVSTLEAQWAKLPAGTDSAVGLMAAARELHQEMEFFLGWEGFETWRLIFLGIGLLVSFLLGRGFLLLIQRGVKPMLKRRNHEIAVRACEAVAHPISVFVFGVGAYIAGAAVAHANAEVFLIYWNLSLAALSAVVAWMLYRLCDVAGDAVIILARRNGGQVNGVLLMLLRTTLKVLILGMSILFIGDQFGVKITTLLAGAGVMGLAIAFAAQDTIANVFGSVMIILDKPFNVGDFVKFDGHEGTVIAIGFRSTRLKTLEGHVITIPNKSCAGAAITNVTDRRFMRQIIDLGLVYETTPAQMERALTLLREIVTMIPGTDHSQPTIAYFSSFDAYAMTLRLKVFYSNPDSKGNPMPVDVDAYALWLGALNLEILKRFNAEGLSFAYPTHVTYYAKMAPFPESQNA